MLFNFVLYFALLTFLDSSVTDESFADETRVRLNTKLNPGIFDEFIHKLPEKIRNRLEGGILRKRLSF